jgi:hypothetical protein
VTYSRQVLGLCPSQPIKTKIKVPNFDLTQLSPSFNLIEILFDSDKKWVAYFGMKHSDGQQSGVLDNSMKKFTDVSSITSIRTTVHKHETWIQRVQFYAAGKEVLSIGGTDPERLGRVEVFDIGKDEQLFGCELDAGNPYVMGITWIKRKKDLILCDPDKNRANE